MSITPADQTDSLKRRLTATASSWDRLPILIELATRQDPDDTDYAYQYQCAIEALTLARALNDRFWIACGLYAVGLNRMRTSRYSEVLPYLEQSSEMFEHLNDPRRKAEADCKIAQVCLSTMEIPRAVELLIKSLKVFRNFDAPEWTARTLSLLGNACSKLGEHSRAIKYYQQALGILMPLGPQSAIGSLYCQLATIYRRLRDNRNQHDYLFKSLEIHREHGDKAGIAIAMGNIAAMYIDALDFDRAAPYIEQSLEVYQELGFVANEAITWGKMSIIYRVKGDIAGAFRCYRIGIGLCKQCEDKLTLGKMYETLGVLCYKTGRLQHCLTYVLKAFSILQEHGDKFYIYTIHQMLGDIYEELGNQELALHHFKEFNRIREEYTSIQQRIQAGCAEMEAEIRALAEQMEKEQSANAALQETIREKETRLLALTLELVRNEETEKKRRRESLSSFSPTANMLRTENWEIFARQFHKVHHGFYPDLLKRYPDLTPTEAKVCSLIRTGISSREIAGILHISKRTVDNHRARIHKKMDIPRGYSLADFITTM